MEVGTKLDPEVVNTENRLPPYVAYVQINMSL